MGASSKPRKRYKPYTPKTPIPQEAVDQLLLPPHIELMKLENGAGDASSDNTLASFLNVAYLVTKPHPDLHTVVKEGLAAIVLMRERHARVGKYGVSGVELEALRSALTVADQFFATLTRDQLLNAWHRAVREAGTKEKS